jgi:hypothetical protein
MDKDFLPELADHYSMLRTNPLAAQAALSRSLMAKRNPAKVRHRSPPVQDFSCLLAGRVATPPGRGGPEGLLVLFGEEYKPKTKRVRRPSSRNIALDNPYSGPLIACWLKPYPRVTR